MPTIASGTLAIPGVVSIKPRKFADDRGFFMETYKAPDYAAVGVDAVFVQDNHSLSLKRGTLRGLHLQTPPRTQAKLVRVVRGAIFDVAVDLRRASATFGLWCGARLTAEGGEQLFVPRGFAHGYITLEDNTEVVYKVDDLYAPECDSGLIWNDPDLAIDWGLPPGEIVTSAKDARLPRFADFKSPF